MIMMKTIPIVLLLLIFVSCGRDAESNNVSQGEAVGFNNNGGDKHMINVGVIVDIGSKFGKFVETIIRMAVKDFYNDNTHYSTRISLHIRDSKGDSLHSLAAALDLLETVKVHALIVPLVSNMELFMATLADKANVPLLSFPAIPLLDEHPYYLEVAPDETTEFHGVSAISEKFKWKHCAILYEDTVDGRQVQPTLYNILQGNNIRVTYQTAISLGASDDQIVDMLRDIMNTRTSIVIVHLSTCLASRVFGNAKMLGMMSEGFAWIVTSKTMNLLNSQESSVHELMQGVLGFRPYITTSAKLQNFILRWKSDSNMETRELNVYGLWAYDSFWALAYAIEREGIKPYSDGVMCNLLDSACLRVNSSGQTLLTKISNAKFIGVAGVFYLKNRTLVHETYEIVNLIGNGERRVGFWKSATGLSKEIYGSSDNLSSNTTIETIIWPGISVTTPTSQRGQTNGKRLRVAISNAIKYPELVSWGHDHETNVTTADGYCIDVFRAAFEWLQYDVSFEFFVFNGNHDDLVYQVYLQKYDAAVGDITIHSNRSRFVDFTSTFTDLGIGVITKLDSSDPWFFTKPLDLGLWIMCGCCFAATGTIVWLIERPINKDFQGTLGQQVGTVLWFAASTLVYAHRETLKSNLSKFVVGIWLFVVLILTSSYTANLSSLLTVQNIKFMKSDYIGSANPLVEGHTMDSLSFHDSRIRYKKPYEYDEALQRGSKKGGVGAIAEEMPYIKTLLARDPDEYAIIQISMTSSGFGFAFQKGSPFAPEVSRAIAGLREEEKLMEIEKKWFSGQSSILPEDSQPPSVNALSIRNFSGLFLISGISTVLAALLLCFTSLQRKLVSLRELSVRGWIQDTDAREVSSQNDN